MMIPRTATLPTTMPAIALPLRPLSEPVVPPLTGEELLLSFGVVDVVGSGTADVVEVLKPSSFGQGSPGVNW